MRLRLLFKYLNYYHFSVSILQNFHFCFSFKCTHIYAELSWQPQKSWNTHWPVLLCHPSVGTWAWPPLFSYLTAHSMRNQEPHEVLSGSFYFIPSSCFLRSSPSCHFWGQSCCDMQPLNVLSVKWWNSLIATVLGWELLCLWALSPRTQPRTQPSVLRHVQAEESTSRWVQNFDSWREAARMTIQLFIYYPKLTTEHQIVTQDFEELSVFNIYRSEVFFQSNHWVVLFF